MSISWGERRAQWERFASWERVEQRRVPSDLSSALRWMSDAWALARRFDPRWGSWESAEKHSLEIARMRALLSRIMRCP